MYVSLAGEFIAVNTLSCPENKFSKIFKTNSLFSYGSDFDLRRRVNGAINTGDSKQTAISLKNLLLDKKFKFGRSRAKFINLSFSFFSIRAIVLLIYEE